MGDPAFPETLTGQDLDHLGADLGTAWRQRLLVVEEQAVCHRCSESSSQWEGLWREGSIKIFLLLLVLKEPAASAAVHGCDPGGPLLDCSGKRAGGRGRDITKERLGEKGSRGSLKHQETKLAQNIPEQILRLNCER